jgi:hypothetical protein
MLKVMAVESYRGLTKGKIYEVRRDESECYRVIDDTGKDYGYYKRRFKTLSCDICSSRKCNSCELNKGTKC